ncbi:MAG TPA: kelch repeat-containing protein [Vicinamibacterales bacterium]|nr:kelch repeat-containing protein [Vicinamibacterales bacterium]
MRTVSATFSSLIVLVFLIQWHSGPTATPLMLIEPRFGHAATLLGDDGILISGGRNDSGLVAAAEIFDPATTTSAATAALLTPRTGHVAVALSDGRVLIVGGEDEGGALASAELFDPATSTISAAGSMAVARRGHTASRLADGSVIVAGGSDGHQTHASLERFDPATGTFATVGAGLAVARQRHTATLLTDGRIVFAGGLSPAGATSSLEYYDPKTDQISVGPSLAIPRYDHGSAAIEEGLVAFVGGTDGTNDLDSAEVLFAPENELGVLDRRWSGSGKAALLPLKHSGTLALLGGISEDGTAGRVDQLDLFDGRFTPMSSLRPLADFTAVAMDGRVFVLGGRAGGLAQSAVDVVRYATLQSDHEDYAPGQPVHLSGSGWSPGESVSILIQQSDGDPETTLTAIADSHGDWTNEEFATAQNDGGVAFRVKAASAVTAVSAYGRFGDSHFVNSLTPTSFVQTPAGKPLTIFGGNFTTGFNHSVEVFSSTGSVGLGVSSIFSNSIGVTLPASISNAPGTYSTRVWQTNRFCQSFCHQHCSFFGGCFCHVHTNCFDSTHTSGFLNFTVLSADATAPFAIAISRLSETPTNAGTVGWSVTFSESVSGVNASDFLLQASGLSGASIAGFSGGGSSYTVFANTATGSGTLRLDLVDNNSIVDGAGNTLGGPAAGDGSLIGAEYTIDRIAPGVVLESSVPEATNQSPIPVTVRFDEPVVGLSLGDISVSNGSATNLAGSGDEYTLDVLPAAEGTVTVSVAAGVVADAAGNSNTAGAPLFRLYDITAPTLTFAFTPESPDGFDGWWKTPGGVPYSWTCSDMLSGIDPTFDGGCPAALTGTVTAQGTSHFAEQVRDRAGNLSVAIDRAVKLDNEAPVLLLAFTPDAPDGHNGWWKTAAGVPFAWTCSDATSGIDPGHNDGCPSALTGTVIAQGNTSFADQVQDVAGNLSAAVSRSVMLDNVAPSIAVALSPDAPASTGWYNDATGAPTVTVTCSDGTSGLVAPCPDPAALADGNHAPRLYSVEDQAGNSASTTRAAVMVDTTAPVLTLAITPDAPDGHNGWWKTTAGVPFVWTCSDTTSGIDPGVNDGCPSVLTGTIIAQGTTALADQVQDVAGNLSGAVSRSVMLDNVAPNLSLSFSPDSPDGTNGWWRAPAGVPYNWTCGDGTSGIDTAFGGGCPSSLADTITAQGVTAFSDQVRDLAGNLSAPVARQVMLDNVGPTVGPQSALDICSLPGNAGWCRGTQSAGFTATDAMSGVASPCIGNSCSFSRSTATNGGAVVVASGAVSDAAGNTSVGASAGPYQIDSMAPVISLTAPAAGGLYTLNANQAASYSCSDSTSGVIACGGPVASGTPFSTAAVGLNTFHVAAQDTAGNTAVPVTHTYFVQYAAVGPCADGPGREVLDPIDPAGASVFRQKRTVPVKFRVCDANGTSIGTAGVVTDFRLYQTAAGTATTTIDEIVDSTTPDSAFRWSDTHWIFNISTDRLRRDVTYYYRITLNDGSFILFRYGLR